MSIADDIRKLPEPYRAAYAVFAYREIDRDESTVTMRFEDGSKLKFKKTYELADEGACEN